jgi:hypothetical protein
MKIKPSTIDNNSYPLTSANQSDELELVKTKAAIFLPSFAELSLYNKRIVFY